ncbi:MAG: DNA internalization-related competence protein ComEC/Rec2 [Bacilli bacterium]
MRKIDVHVTLTLFFCALYCWCMTLAYYYKSVMWFVIGCGCVLYTILILKIRHRAFFVAVILVLIYIYTRSIDVEALKSVEETYQSEVELVQIEVHQKGLKIIGEDNKTGQKNIYYTEEYAPLNHGQVCTISGEASSINEYLNKGNFIYSAYLQQKKIGQVIFATEVSQCREGNAYNLLNMLQNERNRWVYSTTNSLPQPFASYMNALVFGNDEGFSDDITNAYIETGTIHLLAISGSQFAMLYFCIRFLCSRFYIQARFTYVLLIILCGSYIVLAGGSPSVVRAGLMICLYVLSKLWGIKQSMLCTLCVSFFIEWLVDPVICLDVGFIFSYSACILLFLGAKILTQKGWISTILTVNIYVAVSLLPIQLLLFHYINWIAVPLNLLLTVLLHWLVTPFAWLYMLCASLSIEKLLLPLVDGVNVLLEYAHNILTFKLVANMTYGLKTEQSILFLFCVSLFFIFVKVELGKWRKPLLIYASMYYVLVFVLVNMPTFQNEGTITQLDVGQGDSTMIRLPYNEGVVMIDTGGKLVLKGDASEIESKQADFYRRALRPYMMQEGINTIDVLVLTHSDIDHCGAAIALLQNKEVKVLVLPDTEKQRVAFQKVIMEAEKQKIKVEYFASGDVLKIGGQKFKVLSPVRGQVSQSDNNDSLVLQSDFAGIRWLFTGDVEAPGEQVLLQNDIGPVDVLKVAHHGSKTSSSVPFIQAIQPEIAIISAGRRNMFGHPHETTLETLSNQGAKILECSKLGQITFTYKKDGHGGTFSGYSAYDTLQIKEKTD